MQTRKIENLKQKNLYSVKLNQKGKGKINNETK